MKKTMRRLTALLLALVLITTQMALPAMAQTTTTENADGSTTVTDSTTVDNGGGVSTTTSSSTTTYDDGTSSSAASTTVSTTTDNASGGTDTVSVTDTTTNNADGTVTTTANTTTTTATVETNGDTTTITVDSTWTETSETPTGSNPGDVNTETKTGSETATETHSPEKSSQSVTGSEQITKTEDSTTEKTEESVDVTSQEQELQAGPDKEDPFTPATAPDADTVKTDREVTDGFNQADFNDVSKLTEEDLKESEFDFEDTDTKKINLVDQQTPLTVGANQSEIDPSNTAKNPDGTDVYNDNGTPNDPSDDYVTKTVRHTEDLENNQVLPAKFFNDDGTALGDGKHTIDGIDYYLEYEFVKDEDGKPTSKVLEVRATTIVPKETKGTDPGADGAGYDDWTSTTTTSNLSAGEYEEYTPTYTNKTAAGQDESTPTELPKVTAQQYQDAAASAEGFITIKDKDSKGNPVTRTITVERNGNEITGFKIEDVIEMPGEDKVDASLIPVAPADQITTSTYLPTRPTAAAPYEKDGLNFIERVEDILDANGQVIGYEKITEGYDPVSGDLISTATHTYHSGTQTETEETEITLEQDKTMRKITVTSTVTGSKSTQNFSRDADELTIEHIRELAQEIYSIEGTNKEVYIEYEGKFYRVQEGTNHGQITVQAFTPQNSLMTGFYGGYDKGGAKNYHTGTDLSSHWYVDESLRKDSDGTEWHFERYGIESRVKGWLYRTDKDDNYTKSDVAHQYVLENEKDPSKVVYAYCMDASTPSYGGTRYDRDEIVNSGYTDAATAEKIQLAAANGYWGTATSAINRDNIDNTTNTIDDDGAWVADGSFDYVKHFLREQIQYVIDNPGKNTQLEAKLEPLIQKYELRNKTSMSEYRQKALNDGLELDDSNTMNMTNLDWFSHKLSGGLALTATQASLWYYGRSEDETLAEAARTKMMESIVSDASSADALNGYATIYGGNQEAILEVEKDVTNALFRALVLQEEKEVEELNTDNFATTTEITLEGRVTNLEDVDKALYTNAKTVTETVTDVDGNTVERTYVKDGDNGLFNGGISFIVDVKPNDLTGNMVVNVYKVNDDGTNGAVLATQQLSTPNSNLLGKALKAVDDVFSHDNFTATLNADGKIQCTFTDLVLAENVKLNLTLTGDQTLTPGAFMYSVGNTKYTNSQTFVGVESRSRKVDLSVAMEFCSEDPGIEVSSKKGTREQSDYEKIQYSQTGSHESTNVSVTTTATFQDIVKGTKVTTKKLSKQIKEERAWESYVEYLYTTVTTGGGGEEGGAGGAGGPGGVIIPDEAVPLAAVSKTGDASQVLATVCLISLGGAWLLARKEFLFFL